MFLKKHTLKLCTANSNFLQYNKFKNSILKINSFSTLNNNENKELGGQTININSDQQPKEETLDIGEVQEEEAKIKISDIYSIKTKKMGSPNIHNIIDKSRFTENNVKLRSNFNKNEFDNTGSEADRKYIPVTPKLGPFEIVEPQLEGKTYHWCACGMSKKQPFCDGSHRNSKIRPISFKLGEKIDSMSLCGCKLSKVAPFCDGKTCVNLKEKEEKEITQNIQNLYKK